MGQNVSNKRQQRALLMRDLAAEIVRSRGEFVAVQNGPRMLQCRLGELLIGYRGPFQKLRPPSPKYAAECTRMGVFPKVNLPHGLEIWGRDGKVLNIEWDDDGHVALRSYKPGEWEAALEHGRASAPVSLKAADLKAAIDLTGSTLEAIGAKFKKLSGVKIASRHHGS